MNEIITGDARELAKAIPDNSIDLIFTDPPYLKEFLPLYGWLAEEASRVLKPGGFLLTYVGNYWKYETMLQLGQHMSFFFDYVLLMPGDNSILWPRRTICRHKSIMAFVKGAGKPRCNVLSVYNGTTADKRYHIWGQEEGAARYYIDCFSKPGETIWEPFCGGGTTTTVCKILGRQFIAFEIDPLAADIARKRLETVQPVLFAATSVQDTTMWESEVSA
jgi:DNA modification methylase